MANFKDRIPLEPGVDHPRDLNDQTMYPTTSSLHDSPLAPFRIGCDKAGTLVVWGRMPIDGLTGEQLAGLIDAVTTEVALIREETATDENAASAGPERGGLAYRLDQLSRDIDTRDPADAVGSEVAPRHGGRG